MTTRRFQLDYAWIILAASFLVLATSQGARLNYGLFMESLIEEFGWSRSLASLPASLSLLIYGFTQPFVGTFVDVYGPKKIISWSVVLVGVGILALGFAQDLWVFIIFFGIVAGIGIGGSAPVSSSVLIAQWFEKKRGLALGISSSGISVGQFLLTPLIVIIIINQGWRYSFALLGILLLVVTLPLAAFLIREKSGPRYSAEDRSLKKAFIQPWSNVGSAWRHRSFWQINIAYAVCGFSVFFTYGHLAIFARDLGFSEVIAGTSMAILAIIGIVGSVAMGGLSDRLGFPKLLAVSYLARAIGFILLGFFVTGMGTLYLYSAVAGLFFLSTIPLTSGLTRQIYGQSLMGTFLGIFSFSHQMGGTIGTYLGGYLFDIFGNYHVAFLINIILLVIATIVSYRTSAKPLELETVIAPKPALQLSS